MAYPKVQLGPRLQAQTRRYPFLPRPRTLLIVSAAFLFAAAGIFGRNWMTGIFSSGSQLPEKPAVLGSKNPSPSDSSFYYYEVKPGDSLFSISEKFQVNWEIVVQLNSLSEPFSITPGQTVKLPATAAARQQQFFDNLKNKIYVVEEGDTFVSIARRLDISVTTLLQSNPDLKSPERIHRGQIIKVP